MFKFVCDECANEWYIEEYKKTLIKVCPFCLCPVPTEEEIIVDSFEKAILKAIKDLGVDVLKERSRLIGYLLDTSPDYKKEIKILSNACDSGVLRTFYGTKNQDRNSAAKVFAQMQIRMIDEEGIAEQWAKVICESFLNAIHPQKKVPTVNRIPSTKVQSQVKTVKDIQFPSFSKGDKIWGTIIKLNGNCAELDIGSNYSAFMLFSDEVLRARQANKEPWGVGVEIEAHVVDVNHEYKTVELIMRNEKPHAPKTADQLFEEKLKTFMSQSDRKPEKSLKAGTSAVKTSPATNSQSRFSSNSFVGFDGSFAQPPKDKISEPTKTQSNLSTKAGQSDFVMKGSTLVKYAGTAQEVVIPEGVTSIGFRAFYQNNSIKKVVLPEALINIDMEAFSDCCNLAYIEFNRTLWQIGVKAFSNCTKLKKIVFPDLIRIIGVEAFANCTSLETVRLPRELVSLNEKVFLGCKRLDTIVVPNSNLYIDKKSLPAQISIIFE